MFHRNYSTHVPDPRPLWTSPLGLSSCVGTVLGEYNPFLLFAGGCVSSASHSKNAVFLGPAFLCDFLPC